MTYSSDNFQLVPQSLTPIRLKNERPCNKCPEAPRSCTTSPYTVDCCKKCKEQSQVCVPNRFKGRKDRSQTAIMALVQLSERVIAIDDSWKVVPFVGGSLLTLAEYLEAVSASPWAIHQIEEYLAALSTSLLLLGFSTLSITSCSLTPKEARSSAGLMAAIVEYGPYMKSVVEAICITGTLGILYTWHRRKGQPNWLVNHLFYPGFLNSIVGVFSAALATSELATTRNHSRLVDISVAPPSAIPMIPVPRDLRYPLIVTVVSAIVWGSLSCVYGFGKFPSQDYIMRDLGSGDNLSYDHCHNCCNSVVTEDT
ncbi:hypothetical protein BD410DRAFT_793132 [Rickenella mellea]|uniref:Uncharacterized protein n=1 Tax=Rickenella mellea TaxID=50990 RepID=A0A4Y7PT68_9AGAM|nr:hypothetical protein BD410DRAFT_793132 [Rickenella mellea]